MSGRSTPSSFKRLFVGDDDSYAGVVPAQDLVNVAGPYGPIFRVSSTATVDSVLFADKARYDVRWYGAVGDGVANDAPAFQAAATAIKNAGGGVLAIPASTAGYKLNTPVMISSNTIVRGDGYGSWVWPAPGITSIGSIGAGEIGPVCFYNENWQAASITDHDIEFYNLRIGPASVFGCHGIFFRRVKNTTAAGCYFQNLNNGISHLACNYTLVTDCYAEGFLNCAYDHWENPQNATVRDSVVRGMGASGSPFTAYGVLFNVLATDLIAGTSGSNFLCENVFVDGCGTGIFVAPLAPSMPVYNATVRNCHISGAVGAIVYQNVIGGLIENNTINAATQDCITVTLTHTPSHLSKKIVIQNNLLTNCVVGAQSYIRALGESHRVVGNRAISCTAVAGYAVHADDPKTVVTDNDLDGWTLGYILNMYSYNGVATTPALEITADRVNNRWDFRQVVRGRSGLLIGTNANAATLDTYEAGTWTPALAFGGVTTGITYSTREGTYIRIGKMMFVTCDIALSSKGAATGSATITGLSYSGGGSLSGQRLLVSYYANMVSITADPVPLVSAATVVLYAGPMVTGGTALTDANFANNTIFRFHGSYRVA